MILIGGIPRIALRSIRDYFRCLPPGGTCGAASRSLFARMDILWSPALAAKTDARQGWGTQAVLQYKGPDQ